MGVLRLAHVDVRTPDLELSTAYYTEVLGLSVTERTDDAVYLKCWDEEDHHSLRLRSDSRIGMDLFSFRVEKEDDLGELENRLARAGAHVQRTEVLLRREDVEVAGPDRRHREAPVGHQRHRATHRGREGRGLVDVRAVDLVDVAGDGLAHVLGPWERGAVGRSFCHTEQPSFTRNASPA